MVEPSPRWGHFSISADLQGKLYVWRGYTEGFSAEEKIDSSIHSFDVFLESWTEDQTSGDLPPGVYDGASAAVGHSLYLYGGYDGSTVHSALHQLDTRSWKWKLLSSGGPIRKAVCEMVAYDGKLVLFGGYGTPAGAPCVGSQSRVEYVKDRDGHGGWTNEMHTFDLKKGNTEGLYYKLYENKAQLF